MEQSVIDVFLADLARERSTFVQFARKRAHHVDAEDLVQQAFARAYEKAHTLRDVRNAKAWFYRILRRLIVDKFTRQAFREGKLEQLAVELGNVIEEDLAICACGVGLMDTLKDKYRIIVEKVDMHDESLEEAAASLDISRNNATVRLHRARSILREKLTEHCGVASVDACMQCICAPSELK